MRWTEKQTQLFVKIYLSYKHLWDTDDEDYKSHPKRLASYRSIGSKFHDLTNILLDEREVVMKIKSLRSTYNIEIGKINQRPSYRSNIKWFYDWHKCLRNHVIRKGKLSEDIILNPDEEDYVSEDYSSLAAGIENEAKIDESFDSDPFVSQTDDEYVLLLKQEPNIDEEECPRRPHKSRKRKMRQQSFGSDLSRDASDTTTRSHSKEDEFDIYGKYIASQLRNMGIQRALKAQLKIQSIVSDARMDSLIEGEKH